MLSSSEFSMLLKGRADAATRVLERRRTSLEAAIEALEVVGYKVCQGNDGACNVQPPRDRESEYDAYPTVEPTPEAKGAVLADYPAMLTAMGVAEITGMHENSVRRLCRDGKIPRTKAASTPLPAQASWPASLMCVPRVSCWFACCCGACCSCCCASCCGCVTPFCSPSMTDVLSSRRAKNACIVITDAGIVFVRRKVTIDTAFPF